MSHLPGYGDANGGRPSPPISDNADANYEHEKKDQHYHPSEGVYVGADGDGPREEETIRALKPRQISMIAIGGAIGESPAFPHTCHVVWPGLPLTVLQVPVWSLVVVDPSLDLVQVPSSSHTW